MSSDVARFSMTAAGRRMQGYRGLRMFRGPVQTLLRRHRMPAFPQYASLCRGQRLEPSECLAHLGALLRTQVMEGACVFTQLVALLRRHRGPAGEAFADQFPLFRRHRCPMACMVGQATLAPWRQPVPLAAHGGEHALLIGGEAGPVQRLLRHVALHRSFRWRGTQRNRGRRLGRCRCRDQQARKGDQHGWHELPHLSFRLRPQRMPRSAVSRASDKSRGPGPFPSGCCRLRGRAHRHCPGSRRSEPMKRWGQRRV